MGPCNLVEYMEPEKLFLGRELARQIEATVSKLPPRCQLIYRMVREDGMKYKEVAETLDISLKAVENQLLIAMKRIKTVVVAFDENQTQTSNFRRRMLSVFFIATTASSCI